MVTRHVELIRDTSSNTGLLELCFDDIRVYSMG
jgi:hypothetical protein